MLNVNISKKDFMSENKKLIKKWLKSNIKFINNKNDFLVSQEDFPIIKRLGKNNHLMHQWYQWNLLKKIFIIRVLGFELSLFKEVKNKN
jgi:hypothetical protein